MQYNMVRKVDKNTIFLGNEFDGHDEAWRPACENANRYTTYDQYSLTFRGKMTICLTRGGQREGQVAC